MTPRYDGLRTPPERDKAIRDYAAQHPDFSHKEIAEHFEPSLHLSRSRITQILGKAEGEGEQNDR